MLDIVLELAHHVAVFSLVAVLAIEFAMVVPGLTDDRLQQVGRLDGVYGALAGLIIIVGFARVIWGDAGWQFYVFNWVFWAKMALFLAVGLLSIRPTLEIARWRRKGKADHAFIVPLHEIDLVRRYFVYEFIVLAFIPIFAALMARGIGL